MFDRIGDTLYHDGKPIASIDVKNVMIYVYGECWNCCICLVKCVGSEYLKYRVEVGFMIRYCDSEYLIPKLDDFEAILNISLSLKHKYDVAVRSYFSNSDYEVIWYFYNSNYNLVRSYGGSITIAKDIILNYSENNYNFDKKTTEVVNRFAYAFINARMSNTKKALISDLSKN